MGELARWNGHKFEVSGSLMRSFTDFSVKGASSTEEKVSSKQGYVHRKNGSPLEVSLTAQLYAQFGCDVRAESMKFVEEARAGAVDYFYAGGKKLTSCKLMLTGADVTEVEMTATGIWVHAQVKLTLKQSSKNDGSTPSSSSGGGSGSSSSGSSGSNKASVKKSSPSSSSKTSSAGKSTTSAIVMVANQLAKTGYGAKTATQVATVKAKGYAAGLILKAHQTKGTSINSGKKNVASTLSAAATAAKVASSTSKKKKTLPLKK